MNPYHQILEFHMILEKLSGHAHGAQAKQRLLSLEPLMDEALCRRAILDTSGAKRLLQTCGTPPLSVLDGLQETLRLAEAGGMLEIKELYRISRFIIACSRMKAYLTRGEMHENRIAFNSRAFAEADELKNAIECSVDEERVLDDASPTLKKLRRELERLEIKTRERMQQLMQNKKKWLADSYVSKRNGHYVLPVLRQFQNQFQGSVIEVSRSGGTVFIEPASVAELQTEWNRISLEEEQEVRRILYTLSDLTAQYADALGANGRLMDELDFMFAKASFSLETGSNEVFMSREKRVHLRHARHPLLDPEKCVPLDLSLEDSQKGVVITGPNTGGKTVVLKTVGLLTLMAQSGLHIPCDQESILPMRDAVLCDIGDSQSIAQNLSTFSGHMTNVIQILKNVSQDSLVLLDELGSGTDPAEGMAIAIAVLEALRLTGCCFLATTHYDQVKNYVKQASDILSARMAFDSATLRPLYRLETGKTGKSCALEIAYRLGMPQTILTCAGAIVQSGGYSETVPSPTLRRHSSRLINHAASAPYNHELIWKTGDSVEILPDGEKGIVCKPADDQGNVIVQVKGEKRIVRHKRLKLLVPAEQLYPDNYDFSIIFDTVENRKARHIIERRYDENATVVIQEANKG